MQIPSRTIAAQAIDAIDAPVALQLVPPPDPDAPPLTRCSWVVELEDSPEALERLLAQLRRRRCRVTDVAFAAPYLPGDGANVVIGTEVPRERAHLVRAWLANVVSVVSVEAMGA